MALHVAGGMSGRVGRLGFPRAAIIVLGPAPREPRDDIAVSCSWLKRCDYGPAQTIAIDIMVC